MKQDVLDPVESKQISFDDRRYSLFLKVRWALSEIKILLHFPVIFDLSDLFAVELGLQFCQEISRERIGKSIGNKLDDVAAVKVWQISSGFPIGFGILFYPVVEGWHV